MNIVNASLNQQFITVGGKRFHYIWLRKNCPSSRYPAPYKQPYAPKLSQTTNHFKFPKPLFIDLQDEKLIIDWDENPSHRSVFPLPWLLSHAYDPEPELELSNENILWNKAWLQTHPPESYKIHSCTPKTWMDQLFTLGFVVLEDIAPEELESFLLSIGPICNTNRGKIIELKAGSSNGNSSSSGDGSFLGPHNDLTYWQGHRVVQFLYCLEPNASGGESFLVDGFHTAKIFHQHHPDYFQILVETPVQFWSLDQKRRYRFCNKASILEVDKNGEIATVRFSKRNCKPHLPFDQIEPFYKAFSALFNYLKDPDYQYRFPLKSGDCLLFQNFRLLHGRTAFDPTSGVRNLKTGYIDWHFFTGRRSFEQYEF